VNLHSHYELQKQDDSLKSKVKAENTSLMSQSELVSKNCAKFSSELEEKSRQTALKFREKRSKILQRSLRLARDHMIKSNSLRKRIIANQKKLEEIRKTQCLMYKEKITSMSSRTKRFRDIQAAEVLFHNLFLNFDFT
jgi:hypothetical protein